MGNSASCLTADGSAEGPASHTSTRDYLAALSAPELVEYCEEHGLGVEDENDRVELAADLRDKA